MKRRLDSSMAAPQQAARPLLASVLPRRLAALQLLLQPAVDQGLLVAQRVVGIPVRTEHECRIHERAPPFLDDLAVVRREPEVEIDAWRIDVLHDPRIAGGRAPGLEFACHVELRDRDAEPLPGAEPGGSLLNQVHAPLLQIRRGSPLVRVAVTAHVSGIDMARRDRWCGELVWEALLNRAGTTFRVLADSQKQGLDPQKAQALMAGQIGRAHVWSPVTFLYLV